jgi:hypothetical protein
LHEAVRGLFLVKDKMIEFIQEQAFAKTAVQLYAEGEFEHRVDKFFDLLICHLVRGYEGALRGRAGMASGVKQAAGRH